MTLPPEVAAILACPVCRSRLEPRRAQGADEAFDCAPCGLRFPVRDGVPVLLEEQAQRVTT